MGWGEDRSSFNAREAIDASNPNLYEKFIRLIDWNRVVLQAIGEHMKTHPQKPINICGECIQHVLLRIEE